MKPTATNPSRMRRSGIRELMDFAAGFPEVLHLEVGEPDFPTPPHIVEAACAALREGYTKYTPNKGLPSLREAICDKLAAANGITATPEDVVVTVGADSALFEALIATVDPGEEVLVPDPSWPNYAMMCATLGARLVRYRLDPGRNFLPDLAHLEQVTTSRSKILLVNSPSNPTGAVFPRTAVQELLAFAQRHDLYLLSDECYEEIVFGVEHVSPAALDPEGCVISVFSFSKSYAMTGWRVGYVVAPGGLADLISKIQEANTSCAAAVSQKAAEAALRGPQGCVAEMVQAYQRRRDLAVASLRGYDLLVNEPQGSFYILANIARAGMEGYAFAKRLVAQQRVAVAPGETFGPAGAGLVRLSLATDDAVLEEGLRRLAAGVATLAAPK